MNPNEPTALRLPPVSPAASGPLYQQIIEGIQREIREGRLSPGDALPSFRVLAEQLLVSVITVKRAYEELERDGCIYRKQGLGTFVAESANEHSLQLRRAEAEALLREAVDMGLESGMSAAELRRALDAALTENEKRPPRRA